MNSRPEDMQDSVSAMSNLKLDLDLARKRTRVAMEKQEWRGGQMGSLGGLDDLEDDMDDYGVESQTMQVEDPSKHEKVRMIAQLNIEYVNIPVETTVLLIIFTDKSL